MTALTGDGAAAAAPSPSLPRSDDRVTASERRRYRRIMRFAAVTLLTTWWYEIAMPKMGLARFAERGRTSRMQRMAARFHALALSLGGLMIKVGQTLSARMDVLPPEVTTELRSLQDDVPPVPFAELRALAEADLGMTLERAFASFDPRPLAAASLGQAHRARLSDDIAADVGFTDVVVKIQRPGIDRIIEVDLRALTKVGSWLSRIPLVARRVDAPALVAEFAKTSREEVDYLGEAGNATAFAAGEAARNGVRTPAVVWERVAPRVLTLEDVTAIKIGDVSALRAVGIDPGAVAHAYARAMFDQLFIDGFFHGDPHPGNVFVAPGEDGAFRLAFIDFGMMGTVSGSMRAGLRHLMIAVAARDSAGMIAAAQEVGVLLPGGDVIALEPALTTLFDRFGGMGFAELGSVDQREFESFATDFSAVVLDLPIQLPADLLLVMRSMSLTSGVCSTLDPAFNLWHAVEPYAGRLLREETQGAMKDMVDQMTETARVVWTLPQRVDHLITDVNAGRLRVDMSRLESRLDRLDTLAQRILAGILFAGLLAGGALLRLTDPTLGLVLVIVSAVPLIGAIWPASARHRGRR